MVLEYHLLENDMNLHLISHIKNQFKIIKDKSIRPETIRLQEKKITQDSILVYTTFFRLNPKTGGEKSKSR